MSDNILYVIRLVFRLFLKCSPLVPCGIDTYWSFIVILWPLSVKRSPGKPISLLMKFGF